MKWTRNASWAALGVLAVLFLTVIYLVGDAALDKDVSWRARLFLFVLGTLTVVATLLTGRKILKVTSLRSLARPTTVATLALFLTAFVSTMTDALSLLEPRPAVESRPRMIENTAKATLRNTEAIVDVLQRRSEGSAILDKIVGLWGEPGCQVAYRFSVVGQALLIDRERRPPGAPKLERIATILPPGPDEPNVLKVMSAEGESEGRVTTFRYESNGVTERLKWLDNGLPPEMELHACV